MEILTGAMSTLLPKLGDLLKEEYKLQNNVRGEIMFLTAELKSMQAALLKLSEAPLDQPPDIQIKIWAKDVKDLSYDIEDNIDKFMVRVDAGAPNNLHSLKGFICRSLNLMKRVNIRRKISIDIKDIKGRIKEVSDRRDRYRVDNVVAKPIGPTIDSLRLSALYKKVTELVGTEEKRDDLVKMLMEGDEASKQQLKIVSIVGFGGLGKTTLAYLVYEKLKVQFDCGAFVSVSLNPNNKIFKNMLHQLDKDNYKEIDKVLWDETELIRELRQFLQTRRYFIVIDDIWNNSTWKTIKHALIENEYGSRIITTTRILDVAKEAGGVYELNPLSPVDSRKLFYRRIFGIEDKCPPDHLDEVSEKILKKCGGVPLAILTIAYMLASKKGFEYSHKYWCKVYQSMGSGLEDSPDVKDMRRILSVSYYDLPPHLKTCLLYLGLYPEGYIIQRKELVWKWVGEGFVHEEHGKSLYEVGEGYFSELINKSLIQPVKIDINNIMSSCRVHDMVLDLIISLSSEENFLTTLGGQQPVPVPNKIRRLSLKTSEEEDIKKLPTLSLSHVRSLIVFNQAFHSLPTLSSFPVLRVLDLSFCTQVDNHHVMDICNLFHLRYLRLQGTCITEIPREFGNLQFLQVLDIYWTLIRELPSTFVQLTQLLYLPIEYFSGLPDGFGNLRSLQYLAHIIIVSPTMLHNLCGLTKLRHLDIKFSEWDESYEEPFRKCLSNLVSLENISISGCRGGPDFGFGSLLPGPWQLRRIDMEYSTVCAVPRWMSSLSCLSSLSISLETMGGEDLQVLGGIPSLSYLNIRVKKPTQNRDQRLVIDSGYPFRCLTWCRFWSNNMEVVFAQGAMQKLQTLTLKFVVGWTLSRFGDLNLGLENLSSLEHVSVELDNPEEVEAVEAAIRKALEMNPNNPTLEL